MILLVLLWVLFFFSHSLLAANSVKNAAKRLSPNFYRFYRLTYNILSLLFLAAILYIIFYRHELSYMFKPNSISSVAAIVFLISGAVVTMLSFRNYDLREFTGIKQLKEQTPHPSKLVIKGLNMYVRHPLYFGLLLFVLGFFLWQPTQMNLVSLAIIYCYLFIGIKLEEKKLVEEFGDDYRAYQQRVNMLVPFLF
jgi:protein-S-isoprenylcysteine O-methyltransferase Ste14